MNPDREVGGNNCKCCCNCGPPPAPDQCMQVSRLEPANRKECICTPKICNIFGGHDTNYYPDDDCPGPRSRYKPNLNTLGSPVGLVKSNIVLNTKNEKSSDLQPQRLATYMKAFAKIYLTPENEWTSAVIDFLLKEGQQLYTDSNKSDVPQADSPEEIYTETEAKVKRWFDLGECSFQLELTEKFELNPTTPAENQPIPDMTMEFFRPALKAFFRQAKYCLVRLKDWYVLVWRSQGVYFVLDFYGRRVNDFFSDREKGVAMLICLKSLDNVSHLIMNLSELTVNDPFNLREIKVVKLTAPDGKTMNRDFGKRTNQFEVISADYAVLKSYLHLARNRDDPFRSRSSLPVAVAAILAAKIDHPATWNQKVLEKIICYGVNVCLCCWEQCLHSKEPMELERFPTQLKMGQFFATYTLTPRRFDGTWKCVPNYKQSELTIAIENIFANNENNFLLQIDYQMYAVWKKNNYIYLLDPYRHRIDGLANSDSENERTATLRMFRNLDTFFSVLTQMLLETNRTTKFYIHSMVVNKIEVTGKMEGVPVEEAKGDHIDDEIKSLNETICFEEDETKCRLDLGDDEPEDEDITSGVIQVDERDLKSSSSESEEAMEEEEGGMEDLGEYESSSSGDDGHGKRKKKGAKGGRGGKGGKGKDKGGKKKGKSKDKGKDKKKGKGNKDNEKAKKGKSKEKKSKGAKEKSDSGKDKTDKSKANKDQDEENKSKTDKGKDDENKSKDKDKDKDKDDDASKKRKTTGDEDDDAKKKKTESSSVKTSIGASGADGKGDVGKGGDGKGGDGKGGDGKGGDGKGGDGKGGDGKGGDGKGGDGKGSDGKGYGKRDDDRDGYGEEEDGTDGGNLTCRPNKYPGYSPVAKDMAVVGSESGTYESICKLLRAGFKCADRILTMTSWGNYVVFRGFNGFHKIYFLFDGCTCNVNRFRHLDLNCGTAGLLCFQNLHDVISYIIDSQSIRTSLKKRRRNIVDEICKQYC